MEAKLDTGVCDLGTEGDFDSILGNASLSPGGKREASPCQRSRILSIAALTAILATLPAKLSGLLRAPLHDSCWGKIWLRVSLHPLIFIFVSCCKDTSWNTQGVKEKVIRVTDSMLQGLRFCSTWPTWTSKNVLREEKALEIFLAFHHVAVSTSKFIQNNNKPFYYWVCDQEDRNAFWPWELGDPLTSWYPSYPCPQATCLHHSHCVMSSSWSQWASVSDHGCLPDQQVRRKFPWHPCSCYNPASGSSSLLLRTQATSNSPMFVRLVSATNCWLFPSIPMFRFWGTPRRGEVLTIGYLSE